MTRQPAALVVVGSLFLAGCLTEGNFTRKLSRDICRAAEECTRAEFEDEFSSMSDCREETTEDLDDLAECFEEDLDCEFDRAAASDCRSELNSSSCEEYADGDWVNDCFEAWDCPSDAGSPEQVFGICWLRSRR